MTRPTRDSALAAVRVLLAWVGVDPAEAGVVETPRRVADALREMTSGSNQDVGKLLEVQFDESSYEGPVILRGIDFTSTCEHHLLPFTGRALVAYKPAGGRVVGISKLARLVDIFARRLQLQERLTREIAEALVEHLKPAGVAVVVRAEHACMRCRGARKDAELITTHCTGSFHRTTAVSEFVQLMT